LLLASLDGWSFRWFSQEFARVDDMVIKDKRYLKFTIFSLLRQVEILRSSFAQRESVRRRAGMNNIP
jgi:hypothetical protein